MSKDGAPVTYAGLSGTALLAAIVATGTCGFSLFGYGELCRAAGGGSNLH